MMSWKRTFTACPLNYLHRSLTLRYCTLCALEGINMDIPVLVAPMAMQGMAHPGAEPAAARAAANCGVPYVSRVYSLRESGEFESLIRILFHGFKINLITYYLRAEPTHPMKAHALP